MLHPTVVSSPAVYGGADGGVHMVVYPGWYGGRSVHYLVYLLGMVGRVYTTWDASHLSYHGVYIPSMSPNLSYLRV